ncbi:MAG: hypothetical protein WBW01_06260, partial [Terriglobales bacterium]
IFPRGASDTALRLLGRVGETLSRYVSSGLPVTRQVPNLIVIGFDLQQLAIADARCSRELPKALDYIGASDV